MAHNLLGVVSATLFKDYKELLIFLKVLRRYSLSTSISMIIVKLFNIFTWWDILLASTVAYTRIFTNSFPLHFVSCKKVKKDICIKFVGAKKYDPLSYLVGACLE